MKKEWEILLILSATPTQVRLVQALRPDRLLNAAPT
jgi:hypothetical protein